MKIKRLLAKAAATIAAGSLIVSGMVPALADTATNDTTGYNSDNFSNVTNTNVVNVENVSDAYIKNEVKSYSNSGGNSASYNTMGGMVQTGDAVTDVEILNTANVNTTLLDLGSQFSLGNTAGNSITGAESWNEADVVNTNSVNVRNDNTAYMVNKVKAGSNTGDNSASYNTDGAGGVVQSGDAQTVVGLSNRANDSLTQVTGLGDWGENLVGNSITGYNSDNFADIVNTNSVNVNNVSDAFVFNYVKAKANTGRNFSSYNTMGGLVQSGHALVDLGIETDANIVTTLVDAAMGGFSSTAGSSVTGADSWNESNLVNTNVVNVSNRNNKGSSEDAGDYMCESTDLKCMMQHWGVVNIDKDYANTGMNDGSYNTLPGSVATGISLVGKYLRTCLNDTLTSIGSMLP